MNPYLKRIKAQKSASAVSEQPSEGSKPAFECFEGSGPSEVLSFPDAKVRQQTAPDALAQLDFIPVGRECPVSDPADDWGPDEIISTVGGLPLRSTALWCAHCGRFPDQTEEGEVYAVGVSFYCAECCKF